MFVAGIDAHTRYVKVVVVERTGGRVLGPVRVKMEEPARLVALLAPSRPLEVVVETSSSWPRLDAVLSASGRRSSAIARCWWRSARRSSTGFTRS